LAYTKVFDLAPGANNLQTSDFMDVTVLPFGDTLFRMDVAANYIDAEGNLIPFTDVYGTVTVNTQPDLCNDGTPVGECNGDGKLCTAYATDPAFDEACCALANGAWVGGECLFTCASSGKNLGECDTTPTPGIAKRLTYCNPTTATMVESCGECNCFDYYGNIQASCSTDTCVYTAYTAGVSVSIGLP
jgi:hypothetical protein